MSEYYEEDFTDPDREIIRPKVKKRHDPFEYCKWAAGDWDAKFFANTPAHRKQCEQHIEQLRNSPAWYKYKPPKVDKKAATRTKHKDKKTQSWIT